MPKYYTNKACLFAVLCAAALFVSGCNRAYYRTLEEFGYHKRDLLVSSVEDARESQEEAKEQFKSALEKFIEVTDFQGGELRERYEKLNEELKKSEQKAKTVRKRVDDVEDVAKALFREWQSELDQYNDDNLRRASEQKLEATRSSYEKLINAMSRAEKRIDPVLFAFRDQVLFLKHNLNAQAVASLQDELVSVESEVSSLIRVMEDSIREADAFISQMAEG